jgi:hypothetical protein
LQNGDDSELKGRSIEIIQYEKQRILEKVKSISWDNIKRLNIHAIGVPLQKVKIKILVQKKYVKKE